MKKVHENKETEKHSSPKKILWGPLTVWLTAFFKIYWLVFSRRNKFFE